MSDDEEARQQHEHQPAPHALEVATPSPSSNEQQGASRYLPVIKVVGVAAAKGALSLVPGGGLITEVLNVVEQRASEKQQQTLALAVDALSLDAEALRRKLEDDDELAALWTRGLRAAGTAQTREKLQLFAAILAGTVDATHHQRLAASAALRVLEQLGEEDVAILSLISEGECNAPEGPEDPPEFFGASQHWLHERAAELRQLLPICSANLATLTLIRNAWEGTYGALEGRIAWRLAPLGRELIEVVATQPQRPPTDPS